MTTDQLLLRAEFLLKVREAGHINGRVLTYAGFDWLDGELMAIDNELDREKPEGEFQTVYAQIYNPESGECWQCGRDTLWGDALHKMGCQARENEVIGFERVK